MLLSSYPLPVSYIDPLLLWAPTTLTVVQVNIHTTHNYAPTMEDAAADGINAGMDQEGGGTVAINQLAGVSLCFFHAILGAVMMNFVCYAFSMIDQTVITIH